MSLRRTIALRVMISLRMRAVSGLLCRFVSLAQALVELP
jgi:hypothetical protein